jgi:hypothetical protein
MMAKNSVSTATIVAVAFAGLAGAAWLLTDYVNANLVNLPVERVPSKLSGGQAFDVKGWLKTIAPVWVESTEKSHLVNEAESVDDLFNQSNQAVSAEEALPAPAPVEPDYASFLASRMQLDSLGEGGAFINGKFYSVGEAIYDFEYPSNGRQIVPVLLRVDKSSVTVKHGVRLTVLKG